MNCKNGITKQVKILENSPVTPVEDLFYLIRSATKEERIQLLEELGLLDELRSTMEEFSDISYLLNILLLVGDKISLNNISIYDPLQIGEDQEIVTTNKIVSVTDSNGNNVSLMLPTLSVVDIIRHTITYNSNGGILDRTFDRVKEGVTITLPTPYYQDREFLGWTALDTSTNVCTFKVLNDGNFGFKTTRNSHESTNQVGYIKSITVTGSTNLTWDFTSITWDKETGFSLTTVDINGTNCTRALNALNRLALQGGTGTNWVVTSLGLYLLNGQRYIGITDLRKDDIVTIVTETEVSNIFNGIGTNFNNFIGEPISEYTVSSDTTLNAIWGEEVKHYYYLTTIVPSSVPNWSNSNGNVTNLLNLLGWNNWRGNSNQYIVFPYNNSIDINDYFMHNDDYNASLTLTYLRFNSDISSIIIFKWNSRFPLTDSNGSNKVQIK